MGSNPSQGMDVYLRLFCICVVMSTLRPCDGPIPHPKSPTDCLRINKLKRNKVFHGRPMLQSGNNKKKKEIVFNYFCLKYSQLTEYSILSHVLFSWEKQETALHLGLCGILIQRKHS
jgi:hypothetical protein